jgi:signal peptidase I
MIPDLFSAPPSRPASRWLPALMSLALPGLGQLRNGQIDLAIRVFLAFALLSVPGPALIALWLPEGWTVPAVALGLLGAVGLWGWGIVQAWRAAPQGVAPWRGWAGYVLVLLLADAVALPLLIQAVRADQVASFRIPSASMAPTLQPGDVLFADRRYNRPGPGTQAVRRGDIVIFVYPNDRTLYFVKRVVALPGETVERPGAAPYTVPPGHVWLVGDNGAASKDSRDFGAVPLTDVVGRVRQIWWSSGDGRVRWERLGLTPR